MGTTPHTPAPAVVETEGIGNRAANLKQVKFSSDHALPTLLGVRWDSDKIRGIRLEMNDGTHAQAGGYDDSGYPLNQYHFKSMAARFRLRLWQRVPDAIRDLDGRHIQRRSVGLRQRNLAGRRRRLPRRVPCLGQSRQLHQWPCVPGSPRCSHGCRDSTDFRSHPALETLQLSGIGHP